MEKTSKMGKNSKTSGACEAGVPLGTDAIKMHWNGTLEAGRGTPCPSHTMGVPLEPLGMASQFINLEGTTTWACQLVSKAWHASGAQKLHSHYVIPHN